ncbi:hypothetical protein [Bartonella silvatica]
MNDEGVKIVPFFIQAGGTLNKAASMVLEPILLPAPILFMQKRTLPRMF